MLSRLVRSLSGSASAPTRQAPVFEKLEDRHLLAASPIFAGPNVKVINLSSGGVSTNQSLLTLHFTGNINIADVDKIQLRGYGINPLNMKQRKYVINVVKAEVVEADRSFLQITTDCLMRKDGGRIILYEGALADDNGDVLAEQTLIPRKGQNKERFTLARRGFLPSDFTKFTKEIYDEAINPNTANNVVPEATVTANLTAFLQKKVDQGLITAAKRDEALARYNNATVKNIVPDHNLRAAMVSLVGTFAESAIGAFLDGQNASGKHYTILTFGTITDSTIPIAETSIRDDGRLRTVFRTDFQGEPFQALAGVLAHEALHQDDVNGLQEEIFATMVQTMVYGQQALVDPAFVSNQTKLVNLENERLYAMLNSGRTIFPYVGLFDGPNRLHNGNVFPFAKAQEGGTYTSYENLMQRHYAARGAPNQVTAGNNILRAYYTEITGKPAPANLNFSGSLLTDIDGFQSPIGIHAAIKLANALRLRVL